MFLNRRTILLILQKGILLIIHRWILVLWSALILWCRISSRCLHLGMERQLIVPPGLLGLLLLLGQEIPHWTSTSGVQYNFILSPSTSPISTNRPSCSINIWMGSAAMLALSTKGLALGRPFETQRVNLAKSSLKSPTVCTCQGCKACLLMRH